MAEELRISPDGILRTSRSGSMTQAKVAAFVEQARAILETVTEAEPLLVLVDSRQTGKLSATARKAFAQLSRDPRVGKVAVFGLGRYVRMVVSFVNRATGKNNVRFFDSEQQALAWLQTPLPGQVPPGDESGR